MFTCYTLLYSSELVLFGCTRLNFLGLHLGSSEHLYYHLKVLFILTGYRVLGIVYLDQLSDASHTHISYQKGPSLTQRFNNKMR